MLRIPVENLASLEATNVVLRALWAQLRRQFGGFAWQITPRRYGPNQIIRFGWAQLGHCNAGTVEIAIHYRTKGVMDAVLFEPAAPLYDVYSDLDARLKECVTEALKPHSSYKPVNGAIQVALAPNVRLGHYRGKWWVVGALSNNRSEVGVTVGAFDNIDAEHEVKLRLENILNLLAVWTNCSLKEQRTDPKARALDKSSLTDFWTDTDWIDDRPTSDDRALLERECIAFGDKIVAGGIATDDALLRSMRLFHQGLSVSNSSRTMGDLAAVLLVSAMECISEGDPTTCIECGQAVYKISQRVIDLGVQHLGEGSAWLFKRHNALRSKYLHSGRMVGTQPFTGYSIPQLDPAAPEGCAMELGAGQPHNLIEFVSYVIRSEIRSRVRDYGRGCERK